MPALLNTTIEPVIAQIPGFESPPAVIEHTQTNMPNWGQSGWGDRAGIPGGASLIVFAFGPDASSAWRVLLGADDDTPVALAVEVAPEWSDETAAAIRVAIDDALAGSRIAFVGTEAVILSAIAVAKAAGLNDEEVLTAAIGTVVPGVRDEGYTAAVTTTRPIFCARCHTTYTAYVAIGDAFDCPVCGTHVAVYYHYSPVRGAYLARPTGEDA